MVVQVEALPSRMGSSRVATMYLAAPAEPGIAGLYETRRTPYGVRRMIGDVRGGACPRWSRDRPQKHPVQRTVRAAPMCHRNPCPGRPDGVQPVAVFITATDRHTVKVAELGQRANRALTDQRN